MAVLTHPERLGQVKDVLIPSSTDAAPLARSRRLRRHGGSRARDQPERRRRVLAVRLKKFEAEDLLDWLEAHGRSGRLSYVPGEGFTIC